MSAILAIQVLFYNFAVIFYGHSYNVDSFQITKLMHNSFILEQYICYIIILNVLRAYYAYLQEDKLYYYSIWYRHSLYCAAVYRGWRYQML